MPYDEAKIAVAIHAASKSAGVDNRYLAEDLAGVVSLYLERYHDREVPSSDEIRRIIEKILTETGHATIARSYGEHRRHKAAPPPARVATGELFPSAPVLVEGLSRGEVSAWDRARIVVALRKEARLDEKLAEEVASAVEQKIFATGAPRVSTAVVRELVNHELMLRGAKSDVMGQLVVGVPKYDLAQLVSALPDAEKLSRRVGEAALQQFALQELFNPAVAEAHLEGRIHVHGIERPAALYWLTPDLEGLRRSGLRAAGPAHLREPARTARDFTAQVAHVVDASKAIVGALELAHLNLAYADIVEGDAAREADYLAGALWDRDARLGVDVGYLPPLRRPDRALAEQIESLARQAALAMLAALPPGELHVYVSPHAFRNDPDLDVLREACRIAESRGRMTFIFDRHKPPQGLPWRFGPVDNPADDPSWPAIAQAVTINVAQAAYRGGERGVDAELEKAVEAAVRAHLDKKRFLRRFYADDDAGLGQELGWAVEGRGLLRPARFRYSIALAGLHEAAAHLGDERAAFRLLSYAFAMIKQAAEANHVRVALDDLDVADAAARFARIDAHLYPPARGAAPYAPGAHLPGRADRVTAESRLHALMGSGVVRLERAPAADLFSTLVRIHAETLAAQVRVG